MDNDYYDEYEALVESEQWSPALLREVTAATTPSLTALFRRDRETLWIHAYDRARVITCTYPPVPLPDYDRAEQVGVVKEIHVGKRANITDAFYALTSDAVALGWERQACIYVDSGDPWSTPSVLDEGREMPF